MNRKLLILTLFLLAISGFLLHYRIHPFMIPDKIDPSVKHFSPTYFLASFLPMVDVLLVTLLFMSPRTAVYGYLLNGLIVIYGSVLMIHFSINYFMVTNIPPTDWIIKSTLPDVGIAWGDFFVGKVLYDNYMVAK